MRPTTRTDTFMVVRSQRTMRVTLPTLGPPAPPDAAADRTTPTANEPLAETARNLDWMLPPAVPLRIACEWRGERCGRWLDRGSTSR
jgi:hypothetical protein